MMQQQQQGHPEMPMQGQYPPQGCQQMPMQQQGYQYPPQQQQFQQPMQGQYPPQQQQMTPQKQFQQTLPHQNQFAQMGGGWHPGLTLAEFEQLFAAEARTPEGCVKCLLVAAIEYFERQNPEALKMYGMCLPKKDLDGGGCPSKHQTWHSQFGKKCDTSLQAPNAPIPASYLGGTVQNHYQPNFNFQIQQHTSYKSAHVNTADDVKIMIQSGGKDIASPVHLKRNKDGIWKIFEYSSLYTGIKSDKDATDF
jgi:hypothetical protein